MHAFLLDVADGGQRFCIHHEAQGPIKRGQLLYLHPLAEELNKTRRMAALQARALSEVGFEVLQIDLKGCGDSSGDFGDACWQDWVDDALLGCRWLQAQEQTAPLWLWGLRAGCLVASCALSQLASKSNLLFQQPPASGKQLMQQFLRLRLASNMMDGASNGAMAELRQALERGESIEIAGYQINPALAAGLNVATLSPTCIEPEQRRLVWLEVSSRPDSEWPPISLQAHNRWRTAGWQIDTELLAGPPFWQTTEIEEAPALIDGTVRQLLAAVQPACSADSAPAERVRA